MRPRALRFEVGEGLRAASWRIVSGLRLRRVRSGVRPESFDAFGAGPAIDPPFRILRPDRIHLGSEVRIRPNAWLSVVETDESGDGPLLSIGDRSKLGGSLVIACAGRVEIGADVLVSERVFIGDTYHEYRDVERPIRAQGLAAPKPVRVGDGAFVGIGAIVLPGVTIGENACVGAGAVVTKDVPPRSVAVGNPARIVSRWDAESVDWRPARAMATSGG
jgi:acetyltransferase-like isoleucine patch superfamily enzyme